MIMRDFFLLTILTNLVVGFPRAMQQNEESGDSSLGKLVEYFKDFNVTNLLAAFNAAPCYEECFGKHGALPSLNFDESWSTEKTKAVCVQHEKVKTCLAEKPKCSSLVIEIGLHVLEFLCTDDEAVTGLIPCIRRESMNVHTTCERTCKLGATLLDAASLNSKKSDVLNLLDDKGNKFLSVPNVHTLCNASTCFLNCTKSGLDEKCQSGRSLFIDNVLRTVMTRVFQIQYLSDPKVTDTYNSLVSSVLPSQCQHLILQETNIILTTPGLPFSFVTQPHQSVTPVTVAGPALVSEKGGIEANSINERNEENDGDKSRMDMRKESGKESSGYSSAPSMLLLIPLLSMALRY